jgi:uncharacterized membrane protein
LKFFERLDAFARRMGALIALGFWPVAYGVSAASSVWWLAHKGARTALGNNRLDQELRTSAGIAIAVGALGMLGIYAAFHAVSRRRNGEWSWARLTRQLNLWFAPLLASGLLTALLTPSIESKHAMLAACFIAIAGALVALPFYQLRPWALPSKGPAWLPRALTGLTLVGLWALYGGFFTRLGIINHHGLYTATFDLGLYDNIFYQTIRGKLLGCSFLANNYHGAAHFDPILIVLSPIYLLYQHAETLLALQAFWMGAGVFPLYCLAKHHLGCRWQALVVASLWILYPALQGANMYDFHSLSLAAPVLLALFWYALRENTWGYWLTLCVALLIREDIPLLICFIAFSEIRKGTSFGVRNGWLSILVSLGYFVCVKLFFMGAPEKMLTGTQTYSFAYYYADLIPGGRGLVEMFTSILTNPGFTLQLASGEAKILFLLLLFVPLGFLPLFARTGRFALVYGTFFCLLATREPVYSIYFQYGVALFGVAFALLPEGLVRVAKSRAVALYELDSTRLQRVLVAGLWFTSLLISLKFGGFVANEAFRGGFNPPRRHLDEHAQDRYAWVRRVTASIPRDARVGATRRMGPHISNRRYAYDYPGARQYDYLFIDEQQIESKSQRAHKDFLAQQHFQEQERFDSFVLYRRAEPASAPAP